MSIWKRHGTDLDNILEPRKSGDPSMSDTGHKDTNGVDMADYYAPASVGDPYPNTLGYESNGTDLGSEFCEKGTRASVNAQDVSMSFSDSLECEVRATWNASTVGGSGWAGAVRTNNGGQKDTKDVHEWLEEGSASDMEIRFTVTSGTVTGTSHSTGTWGALSEERFVRVEAGPNTSDHESASGIYEIRIGNDIIGGGSWSITASVS